MNQASFIPGRIVFRSLRITLLGPGDFQGETGALRLFPLENPQRGTWAVAMNIIDAAPHFLDLLSIAT